MRRAAPALIDLAFMVAMSIGTMLGWWKSSLTSVAFRHQTANAAVK